LTTEERDGWTTSTRDSSLAAHFEHTVIVGSRRPTVVTAPLRRFASAALR
jgi:methionine aminopeptidase